MQERNTGSHGVKWGFIIGVVYCLLLFLRFYTGENNMVMFGLWALVGYIVVLALLLISGFRLRKELGGYAETKEIFKALFYSVLIFEFMYAVFNHVYLKYVNPDFFYHLKEATENFMVSAKQPQSQIDDILSKIDVDAPKQMNLFDLLKTYLSWVAITGAIAFLFSLMIKRKNYVDQRQDNFLQP